MSWKEEDLATQIFSCYVNHRASYFFLDERNYIHTDYDIIALILYILSLAVLDNRIFCNKCEQISSSLFLSLKEHNFIFQPRLHI